MKDIKKKIEAILFSLNKLMRLNLLLKIKFFRE